MNKIITKVIKLAANFNAASVTFRANQHIEAGTNCYAYALGITDHGPASPGKLLEPLNSPNKIYEPNDLTAENIHLLLTEVDGLIKLDEDDLSSLKLKTNVIAAYLHPYDDVHFYRMHRDGTWSQHKGGIDGISERDCKGDIITDPRQARRGRYNDFVGFYGLPDHGITYLKVQ